MESLESETLSMEQIAKTVLAESKGLNPIQVIASLSASGISPYIIMNAASNAGISFQLVNAGIEKGEAFKATVSGR